MNKKSSIKHAAEENGTINQILPRP